MNECLFVAITIISLTLVLVCLRLGTNMVLGLVVTYLLIANLFAAKLTVIFGLPSSLAIPLYAAIFLATDAMAEHWGKRLAFQVVWMGFLAQLCLVVFGQLMIRGSAFGDPAVSDALSTVFSFVPRITLGSFIAYLVSQSFDIHFYHFLKNRFKGKHLWLRNCCSTTISQALDSGVFLVIAFYGVLPNLFQFFLSVWAFKVVIAASDTPFIYASYWILGKDYSSQTRETEGSGSDG